MARGSTQSLAKGRKCLVSLKVTQSKGSLPTEYLTCDEVAAELRVTVRWIWKLVRADDLPHVRVGRRIRITRKDLTDWLHKRKEPD